MLIWIFSCKSVKCVFHVCIVPLYPYVWKKKTVFVSHNLRCNRKPDQDTIVPRWNPFFFFYWRCFFQKLGHCRVTVSSAGWSQDSPHAKWQLRENDGALSASQWDLFSSLAPPFATSCAIIHTRVLLHDCGLWRSAPLCFSLWAHDPPVSARGDTLSTQWQRRS